MVMKDIFEFIEKCGFEVSNKEDYNKIEIRDSKTNEPIERYLAGSNNFYGEGKHVCIMSNYAEVVLGNGVEITKYNSLETSPKKRSEYRITYKCSDSEHLVIDIECDYADSKDAGNLTVKTFDNRYGCNNKIFCIKQSPLKTEFFNGNNNWFVKIEDCNSDLYLKYIMEFLNKNDFVSEYSNIQEAIKIVMYFVLKNIEKLIESRIDNSENYIKSLNKEKEKSQEKIDKIDTDIGRLKKISQDRQIVKE